MTNSDLAFWGTKVIAGDYGRFRIFQVSRPGKPKLLTDLRCPGVQSDVSVWADLLFQSVPDVENGRLLIYVSSYALTAGSLGPECLADTD